MSNFNSLDDQLDHLVDTRQMSYTEAHRALGLTVPPTEPLKAAATQARIEAHDYYSQEFGLTGDVERTPEEQQKFQLGKRAVLGALEAAKNGTPMTEQEIATMLNPDVDSE